MQISIRNATGSATEVIEKNVSAGRTMIRMARGQQLEVVDETTGRAPAQLRARRGGPNGEDLILESNGEILEIQGFFEMASEGEGGVSVSFPGGEVPEITPAMLEAQFAAAEWAGAAPFAAPHGEGLATMAAAAGASSAGASSAAAAAGGGVAASGISTGWLVLGGLAAVGVGVALADDDDDSPAPPPQPEPEPEPTFELSASVEEVNEGGEVVFTLTTTNVAPGTEYTYTISGEGIDEGDLVGGQLTGTVTIGENGKALIPITLKKDAQTEGVETLKVTIAGKEYEVSVNDTSLDPVPKFEVSANVDEVDEGGDVVFTVTTENVKQGTEVAYTISGEGIDNTDFVGGQLSGKVTIGPDGKAVIPVSLAKDLTTEGLETLTITIEGASAEVKVNDTSRDPDATFDLSASTKIVEEGADVVFTLATTRVDPGTVYEYTISGVDEADVVGGQLNGTLTIGPDGKALIPVTLVADNLTEGAETLTFEIEALGLKYEVSVKDTSLTPTLVLTPGVDVLKGAAADDVIFGNSDTYTAGDQIDGGTGQDTLNLSFASGTVAESVTVKNVETVNVTTTAGDDGAVDLVMTNYEGVNQINVQHARSDLNIVDQQELVDVSIEDTNVHVDLDYDSQLVTGESDSLNVSVREFGDSDHQGRLTIDEGIESLNLEIQDERNEDSNFAVEAEGVTKVHLSGGEAGQSAIIDLEINSDRAAGATFDGRHFVGDLTLTGLQGGKHTYSHAVEFTQGLEPGQTATITIGGKLTITVEAGEYGLTAAELADEFALKLNSALGSSGDAQSLDVGGELGVLIAHNLHSPATDVQIDVAGTAVELLDSFQYTVDGEDVSPDILDKKDHSEVSTLLLGAGDDRVQIADGDITHEDTYDLGDGENFLNVDSGNVYGTVTFGDGGSELYVGEDISGTASVSFGDGGEVGNSARVYGAVTGQATVTFADGDNRMEVEENIDGLVRVEFGGGGENSLLVGGNVAEFAQVVFNGDGDNAVVLSDGSITSSASVSFGNGGNTLLVDENISSGASVSFGNGDNVVAVGEDIASGASLSFGNGANELTVEGDVSGSGTQITFGNGANEVTVEGDVRSANVELGAGANNVTIEGDVRRANLQFGGGESEAEGDNRVEIGGDIARSTLELGDGADEVVIGSNVVESTINLGNGDNELSIGGEIRAGAQVTTGAGSDTFNLGDGKSGAVRLRGDDTKSVVDLGAGNDTATITVGGNDATDVLVRSGGVLDGGDGHDILTIRAVDDLDVVARTRKQAFTVTLDGNYVQGDLVTVTVAGEDFTYEVQYSDVVLGEIETTRENVTQGLLAKLNEAIGEDELAFTVTSDGATTLVLTAESIAADVVVEATGATLEHKRFADAEIVNFETLELVAANPITEGEDANDNGHHSADISVDFALVQGVETLNLTSEVTLREKVKDEELNGTYTRYKKGDEVEFTLNNLTRELSEAITISANEVTATGNRQVERVIIQGESSQLIQEGDVVTLTIDGEEYSLTVTAADLSGDDRTQDALNILNRLATELTEKGFDVAVDEVDGDVGLTWIGSNEQVAIDLTVTRGEDNLDLGELGVDLECKQKATATDDEQTDVVVNAYLRKEDDGTDNALALTLNGGGDFDLAIVTEGVGSLGEDVGRYEDLEIDVQDGHSHTIDTNGGEDDDQFAGGRIALTGGVAGASIVFTNVAAKEFTSTSDSNVTVHFGEGAEPASPGYKYQVTTLGGEDVVDMRNVLFGFDATVNLGDGVDRLIIGNGNGTADSSELLDADRMFKNVRNVEILEVDGDILSEDSLVFDDAALDAGFQELIVRENSSLRFTVGDDFTEDLKVTIEDNVDLVMDVRSEGESNVSITAADGLDATIEIRDQSGASFSLEGGDCADVDLTSRGNGSVDVTVGDHNDVTLNQHGNGDVWFSGGVDSDVTINQHALGGVSVSAGGESDVHVYFSEVAGGNDADVSVTLSGSGGNTVTLEGLQDAQNVSVDVTLDGSYATVADLGEGADSDSTDLNVEGESGIDTLTLRSADGEALTAVEVVTADSWATDQNDDGPDMVIDASAVSASVGVLIDASNETDADLEITGSESSRNALFGGGQSDTIKGGNAEDLLVGDVLARSQVTRVEFGDGESYTDSTAFVLKVGEDTLTMLLDGSIADHDPATLPELLAQAAADWINGAGDDYDPDAPGPFDPITPIYYSTPTGEFSSVLEAKVEDGALILIGSTGESFTVELEVATYVPDPDFSLPATPENPPVLVEPGVPASDWVETIQEAREARNSSDTLQGGDGNDLYVIGASQFDNMDTIEGLYLGQGEDQGDVILLGAAQGGLTENDLPELLHTQITQVVNAGEVKALEGEGLVDLQAAVATLFEEGDGVFETATNAAGLFSFEGETYLIAVGSEATGAFGADDFIVKVTGVTGTLDVTDFDSSFWTWTPGP